MSIFRQMSWIRMLKRFNKARSRCPVVVHEKMNAVFRRKTQNRKKDKFPDFRSFIAIFVKLSIDFVEENVENSHIGNNALSSRVFRKHNCCFLNEKISSCHRKQQKNKNFSFFKDFMQFFPNGRQTSSIETFKRVNKERMCCPVCLKKR